MPMRSWLARAACFALLAVPAVAVLSKEPASGRSKPAPELPESMPWDLAALSDPPSFEWLDDRFRAAVPVYGCGHLRDNSTWLGDFERIGHEPGWAPAEIGAFIDAELLGKPRLPVAADGTLVGPKPPADARAFFFTATTPAGLQVSSPAVIGGR